MRKIPLFVLLTLGTLLLVPALDTLACTVCYGAADSPVVRGAEKASLFLIGVTYFLLIGGVVGFVAIRRKKLAELQSSADDPGSST